MVENYSHFISVQIDQNFFQNTFFVINWKLLSKRDENQKINIVSQKQYPKQEIKNQ